MPKSIDIVVQGNGAAFQPNRAGVQVGDRIHWNNETNEDHWLETTTGGFITDNIPPGSVSNPGFIAAADISYRCRLHPQEQGTIEIVPAVVMAATLELAAAAPSAAALAAASPPKAGGKNENT
jgi:plastocyanin